MTADTTSADRAAAEAWITARAASVDPAIGLTDKLFEEFVVVYIAGRTEATERAAAKSAGKMLRSGMELARVQCAELLLCEADKYEKDGEPGDLGYNFWGWRDMAKTLRKVADRIRNTQGGDVNHYTMRVIEQAAKACHAKFILRISRANVLDWDDLDQFEKDTWIAAVEAALYVVSPHMAVMLDLPKVPSFELPDIGMGFDDVEPIREQLEGFDCHAGFSP